MGLLDSFLNSALSIVPMSRQIKLSDDDLNKASSHFFGNFGAIQSINIAMHDGWFSSDAHIIHNLTEYDMRADFEITRFQVTKQIQIIEFRQINEFQINAAGWRNKIMLAVMKIIISTFLGKDLLQWGLEDTIGITVTGDTIAVDLEKIGAKAALYVGIMDKVMSDAPLLLPLLQDGTAVLSDYVSITSAECQEGALVINVQYGNS